MNEGLKWGKKDEGEVLDGPNENLLCLGLQFAPSAGY